MPITNELGRQESVQDISRKPCQFFLSFKYLLTKKYMFVKPLVEIGVCSFPDYKLHSIGRQFADASLLI